MKKFTLILGAVLFLAGTVNAWTEPGSAPPAGNVAAPLRTATSPLSVSGTNITLGNLPISIFGSGTGASASTYWRGDGTWATPAVGGGGTIGGSGSTNYLPKFTAGTTIGNSQIYDTGTYVGVGKTNPAEVLDVNGTVKSLNSTTGADYASNWFRSYGNSGWYNQDYGIGIYALDTTWIRTYGNAGIWANNSSIGTNGCLTVGYGGAGCSGGYGIFAGSVSIGTQNPGEKLEVVGNIKASGTISNYGTAAYTNGMSTYVLNTDYLYPAGNSDPLMYVGMTGTKVAFRGKIGLNNDNPTYDVDITGNIRATGVMRANGNNTAYFCGGDDACLYDVNQANTVAIKGEQDTSLGNLQLGSSATIYGSGGNIGIGASSPSYKLQVAGNTYVSGNLAADGYFGPDPNLSVGLDFDGSGNASFTGNIVAGGGNGITGEYLYYNSAIGASTSLCRSPGSPYRVSNCTSLLKYKKNIEDLNLGLDTVMKLRPVTFDWKDPNMGGHDLGFIAEEVNAVDPVLSEYANGKLSGVKYAQMSALLVKSVQELKAKNDALEARVAALEAKLGK